MAYGSAETLIWRNRETVGCNALRKTWDDNPEAHHNAERHRAVSNAMQEGGQTKV